MERDSYNAKGADGMSVLLTKNNYCRYGCNAKPFSVRQNLSDRFWTKYGPCERMPGSWREECVRAASEIAVLAGKGLRVCLSGGVDSEIVAESFRLAGIKFTAAILRMKDGLNEHDISWAISYCKAHSIPIQFFDFDPIGYLNSEEILVKSRQANCNLPGILMQLKLIDLICEQGGFPVLGSGDLRLKNINGKWGLFQIEDYWGYFFYQQFKGILGVTRFFHWTPELVLSFLNDPTVGDLLQNKFPNVFDSNEIKAKIHENHFKLAPRPKYYGFENFSQLNDQVTKKLMSLNPKKNNFAFLDPDRVRADLQKF